MGVAGGDLVSNEQVREGDWHWWPLLFWWFWWQIASMVAVLAPTFLCYYIVVILQIASMVAVLAAIFCVTSYYMVVL